MRWRAMTVEGTKWLLLLLRVVLALCGIVQNTSTAAASLSPAAHARVPLAAASRVFLIWCGSLSGVSNSINALSALSTLPYFVVFLSSSTLSHSLPSSMRTNAYRRFTCRYWALGPSCPDGARCIFAHRDTGQLATPSHQPGTCIVYSQLGDCYRGTQCEYEHRHTGVTGLYQGSEQDHLTSISR
jgi:hypothetical protein